MPGLFETSLKHAYQIAVVWVIVAVVVSQAADEEYIKNTLRDTVSSLCELNKEGHFGSCCSSFNVASISLESSTSWNFFLSAMKFDSDGITVLFVV